MKPRRPFSVTLLACLVLTVTMINLARWTFALWNWDFLLELLPVSPLYQVLSGLFWSLVGLPLAWGLWRGANWAPGFTRPALLIFSLYYWTDRLLLPGYAGRNTNWPFALGVNLFVLVWSFLVLSRPRARDFFGEMHEREPENPAIT